MQDRTVTKTKTSPCMNIAVRRDKEEEDDDDDDDEEEEDKKLNKASVAFEV